MAPLDDGLSRHHLMPRSRGGTDDPDNIAHIPDYLHRAWHQVFGNQIPEEALQHILNIIPPRSLDRVQTLRPDGTCLEVFHLGRPKLRTPILEAWSLLFPDNHPFLILHYWGRRWVPPRYFDHVLATSEGECFDIHQLNLANIPPLFQQTYRASDFAGLGLPEKVNPHNHRPVRKISHRPKPIDWGHRWRFARDYAPESENGNE